MPDDYWKKFGEKVEAAKNHGLVICSDCGAFRRKDGHCEECHVIVCKKCKTKFLNQHDYRGRGRKVCPDCVGERSGNTEPRPGERLGGGLETKEE